MSERSLRLSEAVLRLAAKLRERGQTVAFAESCTGGLLAASFAAEAGVSDVFHGGVVAYANDVKTRVLGVPDSVIRQLGAVSTTTALSMARGVSRVIDATWGASITGVAGPSGGSVQKPVGTVCFAIVGPGVEWTSQQHFAGDRNDVQIQSARFLIESLTRFFEP